nr:hypothetical protein [Tanacetum cinerariifolium]
HRLHPAQDGGQQPLGLVADEQKDGSGRRLLQQLQHRVGGGRVHQLGQPDDDNFKLRLKCLERHQFEQRAGFLLRDAALLVFGPDV